VKRFLGAAVFLAAVAGVAACQAEAPPRGLEATCAKACEVQASQCSPHQCRRGCNLVLDRLAENEGDRVLACITSAKAACDDRAWAHCATRIGPHADGGPPPPQPPPSVLDDTEGD
jgi:hypothetical protein